MEANKAELKDTMVLATATNDAKLEDKMAALEKKLGMLIKLAEGERLDELEQVMKHASDILRSTGVYCARYTCFILHDRAHYCGFMIGHSLGRMGHFT